MYHSVAPHVSQYDRRQQHGQQQQGQMYMYPDREQQAYPAGGVQTQYRQAQHQQPSRQLMSWREDGTPAPAQIQFRPVPVEREHLLAHRSSDSEWTRRREALGTFQPGGFEKFSLHGGRHHHQVQGWPVLHDDTMNMAAEHRRRSSAIRHEYEREYGTRSPSRWQPDAKPQLGVMASYELTDIPGATERKTALGFIMNQGEQSRARFVQTGGEYSPHLTINQSLRRRRSSPRITPRVETLRAPYKPRGEYEEAEEKHSVFYESRDVIAYNSAHCEARRSRQAVPRCPVNTRAPRPAFVEMTHAPPSALQALPAATAKVTHELTSVPVAGAKARVRPVPSGTSQQKRRARECKIDGCPNYIINKGLCFRHGVRLFQANSIGSLPHTSLSNDPHCGSVKCLASTCTRKGKSRGFCWAHGGGTKCSSDSCSKVAVSNGLCWAHGGGKRCMFESCEKAAYKRTHNYCVTHHELLKDGNVTLEV